MKNSCIKKIAVLFAAFAFVFCPVKIFAGESVDEAAELMQRTNDFYNKGNYVKAVQSVNLLMELYEGRSGFSENQKLMAEAVYYAWINSIYKTASINNGKVDRKEFDNAILCLKLHPQAASARTVSLIDKMFDDEIKFFEKLRRSYVDESKRNQWRKVNAEISVLEKSRKELEYVINGDVSVDMIKRYLDEKEREKTDKIYKVMIFTTGVFLFIALVILIYFIIKNYKRRVEAQHNFETTMEVVALLTRDFNGSKISFVKDANDKVIDEKYDTTGVFASKKEFAFDSVANEFFTNEDSKRKFMELETECYQLGLKIDEVTGRKNNSRKVSELVYKISNAAGVNQNTALLYHCAAMVYDAGFLSVKKQILSAEHLTIKERYEVRSHVQNAQKYLEFVPPELQVVFMDAAEYHHENFDGKGYMAGMRGAKIPLIARMIRVCESYVSLVNKRIYRETAMDRYSALTELKRKSGIYDPKILSLLEKVI